MIAVVQTLHHTINGTGLRTPSGTWIERSTYSRVIIILQKLKIEFLDILA